MKNSITANDILKLLLKKHKDDICVPECKHGQSWTREKSKRFDLWAMKKSYTNPMTWIYEVKVSRQDFLKDNKWQSYLPYCTDFYFVAPYGIIDVNEVPEQSGLLLSSKNGTRLYCKKKAPHREVKIPDSVFKYILMSRVKIVNSTYYNNESSRKEYWRQWLENKQDSKELGWNVSKKIRRLYEKNIELVQINQKHLDGKIEKLEDVERILKKLGFNENNLGWRYDEKLRERVAEINEGFPEKDVVKHLESAILNLQNTIKTIKRRE